MANFSPEQLLLALQSTIERMEPGRIWVAFSGGLDSTVLLHALAARRDLLPAPLHAVHVNHGLHAESACWADHCLSVCQSLDVPLESFGIMVDPVPGASLEAAAREGRYDVFREVLAANEWLLTAQHQDDQLETFLLQALRGAGPHGLSAMPRCIRLAQGWLLRPLLDWPRAELEAWARSRGLNWLEDPSNSDERFDRNYLRRQVVPRLKSRWPSAGATFARAARHCAEAAELVDELAAQDLTACTPDHALPVASLRRLDLPRRRNLVRHWLEWRGFPRPSEKKLEHILSDVLEAGPDAGPCVDWADVAVRRYRGWLYAERALPIPQGGGWSGASFELGAGWGRLRREPSSGPGLPEGRVEVRFRLGGEKLRPLGRTHHHELKKLFQEAAVLPWRRQQLPLIYIEDQLAAVGDLWVNADIVQETGWRVRWDGKPKIVASPAT